MFSTAIPQSRAAPSPHHRLEFGIVHLNVTVLCHGSGTAPSSCSWLRRAKSTINWILSLLTFCLSPCCPANILIWCDSVSGVSLIPWLMIDLSRCDQEINQKISHLHSYCWKESQMSQIKYVSFHLTASSALVGRKFGIFWRVVFSIETPLPSSEWRFWSLHI